MVTTEALYDIFLRHPKVSTDTRTIPSGSIFFALKGGNFNGNTFAKDALAKGAAYAVVDEKEYAGDNCLLVENVLGALQDLARHHRAMLGKKGLKVLGLTGSNGKTTTKELVARVLSKKFRTLYTQGNLNNHIGVPLTLLQLDETHEMAVIEMGANHQGEIALLSSIAMPDFGLITNIGLAHLEGFGGPEGVLKGKTELFRDLEKRNGFAFVLADDARLLNAAANLKHTTYGCTDEYAEVKGMFVAADPFVHFTWKTDNVPVHEVQSQMIGAYNLPNMIAACAVGHHFGIDAKEIDEAIASYAPSNNRSQMEKRGQNTLILDCYNANPSSMSAAIENLAKMQAVKKIVVLGDMFELGDSAAAEHQRIADLLAEKLPGATVLLVGKLFGETKGHEKMIRLPDTSAAGEWLKSHRPENALILIKGSRGMKMEQAAVFD